MPMSTKCQQNEKKMTINIDYDIYDRFTIEHFPVCQSMILTTSFFLLATIGISHKKVLHYEKNCKNVSILF
jgi:hypothetical protein